MPRCVRPFHLKLAANYRLALRAARSRRGSMLTVSILLLFPLLCSLYCLYAQWKSRQPWPDFGGRVAELSSLEEWEALVERAAAEKLIIVVDLFALWCPPCRRAAPVYAQMSEEMRGAAFVKINVDKSPELATELGARVLPTFKLFRSTPLSPLTTVGTTVGQAREGGLKELAAVRGWDEKELAAVRGWDEKQLRYLLELHGACASCGEGEKSRLVPPANT